MLKLNHMTQQLHINLQYNLFDRSNLFLKYEPGFNRSSNCLGSSSQRSSSWSFQCTSQIFISRSYSDIFSDGQFRLSFSWTVKSNCTSLLATLSRISGYCRSVYWLAGEDIVSAWFTFKVIGCNFLPSYFSSNLPFLTPLVLMLPRKWLRVWSLATCPPKLCWPSRFMQLMHRSKTMCSVVLQKQWFVSGM